MAGAGVTRRGVHAVLFDVDFTLVRPGPDLGPEGYRRVGERHGLRLEPGLYDVARTRALEALQRHPELEHDNEIWLAFTERIVREMGGDGDGAAAHAVAVEIAEGWDRHENFELYEDVPAVFAELRRYGLKLGLVSNTSRDLDEFVTHHRLDVDAALASGKHGRTKPHSSIFLAVLEHLAVPPEEAAMVGDSPEDDIDGARLLGMRAFLIDREGRHPEWAPDLRDLYGLPAALGLVRPGVL
jgi:HAD superfamily hydrolase (TIGR01662 family)